MVMGAFVRGIRCIALCGATNKRAQEVEELRQKLQEVELGTALSQADSNFLQRELEEKEADIGEEGGGVFERDVSCSFCGPIYLVAHLFRPTHGTSVETSRGLSPAARWRVLHPQSKFKPTRAWRPPAFVSPPSSLARMPFTGTVLATPLCPY